MSKNAFAPLLAIQILVLILSACNSRPDTVVQRAVAKPESAASPDPLAATGQSGTNSAATTAAADTVAYSGDSLQYLARPSFELLSYRLTPDTLQLISTSPFLYYPFGKQASVASFKKQYPSFVFKRQTDSFDSSAVLYRGVAPNGFDLGNCGGPGVGASDSSC